MNEFKFNVLQIREETESNKTYDWIFDEDLLGKGSISKVYKGYDKKSKESFGCKLIKFESEKDL